MNPCPSAWSKKSRTPKLGRSSEGTLFSFGFSMRLDGQSATEDFWDAFGRLMDEGG